jgi:hypothetical protein
MRCDSSVLGGQLDDRLKQRRIGALGEIHPQHRLERRRVELRDLDQNAPGLRMVRVGPHRGLLHDRLEPPDLLGVRFGPVGRREVGVDQERRGDRIEGSGQRARHRFARRDERLGEQRGVDPSLTEGDEDLGREHLGEADRLRMAAVLVDPGLHAVLRQTA